MGQVADPSLSAKELSEQMRSMPDDQKLTFLHSLPPAKTVEIANYLAYDDPNQQSPGENYEKKDEVVGTVNGQQVINRSWIRKTPTVLNRQIDNQGPQSLSPDEANRIAAIRGDTDISHNPTGGWLDNGVGLTARAAAKGFAALPSLVADHTILPAFDAMFSVPGVDTGSKVSDLGLQGMIDSAADAGGLKAPETPGERVYSDVVGTVAGLGGGKVVGKGLQALAGDSPTLVGAGSRWLGKALDAPITKGLVVGAAAGGAAGGIERERGGSQIDQLAASLIGGGVPSLAGAGRDAAVRRLLVGGAPERATLNDTINTFADAGAVPTVGQATGGEGAKTTESFLSRLFGSSGVMQKNARVQEAGVGDRVQSLADSLAANANPTEAGDRVAAQFAPLARTNPTPNFLSKAKDEVSRSYQAFDKIVPPTTILPANNTAKFLSEKTLPTPGASRFTTNANINPSATNWQSTLKDLEADIKDNGGQGISLAGMQKARSSIGNQLTDSMFDTSVPTSELRGMYASLSQDMREGAAAIDAKAAAVGQRSNAVGQLERATGKAEQLFDHLDLVRPIVERAGGGEKVFEAATGGIANGATKLKGIYDSMPQDTREFLSSAIIKRMAKPAPGSDGFDLQTFFKNYDRISPEARAQIFGRVSPEFQRNFEEIASVAKTIKGEREEFGFATSPKEGRTGLQMLLYPVLFTGTGTATLAAGGGGNALASAGAAVGTTTAAMVGARLLAKKMTDPKFVAFLAKANHIPPSLLPSELNQLGQEGRREGDPDLVALTEYMQSNLPKEQK